MEAYRRRVQAFGVNAIVVDGHDVEEICKVSACQPVLTFRHSSQLFIFLAYSEDDIEVRSPSTQQPRPLHVLGKNIFVRLCIFRLKPHLPPSLSKIDIFLLVIHQHAHV
jgi:hypothetical protein